LIGNSIFSYAAAAPFARTRNASLPLPEVSAPFPVSSEGRGEGGEGGEGERLECGIGKESTSGYVSERNADEFYVNLSRGWGWMGEGTMAAVSIHRISLYRMRGKNSRNSIYTCVKFKILLCLNGNPSFVWDETFSRTRSCENSRTRNDKSPPPTPAFKISGMYRHTKIHPRKTFIANKNLCKHYSENIFVCYIVKNFTCFRSKKYGKMILPTDIVLCK